METGFIFYLSSCWYFRSDAKVTKGLISTVSVTRHNKENEDIGYYVGDTLSLSSKKEVEPLREGKCIYRHFDGQSYVGQWYRGKMHGFGKLYFANETLRYEGEFKNGLFHGYGIEYSESQVK